MQREIRVLFQKEKIEYCSALDYAYCREINPKILSKLSFEPKSVFVFLVPYYVGEAKNISIYASSVDYHIIIKDIAEKIIEGLKALFPDNRFSAFADHSPIDERKAAISASLGVMGDNGLLINEKYGSYVFIAEIISDVLPEKIPAITPKSAKTCEHCGLCSAACPTDTVSNRDRTCLSDITQRKGDLSSCEIEIMKKCNTVWGCDECQRCCPHNSDPVVTPISAFFEDRIEYLTSSKLEELGEEDFSKRAFAWRKKETVLRNLKLLGY